MILSNTSPLHPAQTAELSAYQYLAVILSNTSPLHHLVITGAVAVFPALYQRRSS